jgi:hypothetical protein
MSDIPEVSVVVRGADRPRHLEALSNARWDGLEGAWAKFDWARKQAKALEAEVTRDKHTMTLTRHPKLYPTKQPNVFVGFYVITSMSPTSPEWGYRLGDIGHNLRCCLDYAAWQLAILDSGGQPFRHTQFPICNDDEAFEKFEWHLKSLTPDHVTFLKAAQPYHAVRAVFEDGESPEPLEGVIGLVVLRELNDRDKHQVPTLTMSVTSDRRQPRITRFQGCSRAVIAHINPNITLEPGTPILQVMVWDPDFSTLDVEVDYNPSLDVVMPEGEALPATIFLIFQAVENVLRSTQDLLLAPPLGLA